MASSQWRGRSPRRRMPPGQQSQPGSTVVFFGETQSHIPVASCTKEEGLAPIDRCKWHKVTQEYVQMISYTTQHWRQEVQAPGAPTGGPTRPVWMPRVPYVVRSAQKATDKTYPGYPVPGPGTSIIPSIVGRARVQFFSMSALDLPTSSSCANKHSHARLAQTTAVRRLLRPLANEATLLRPRYALSAPHGRT